MCKVLMIPKITKKTRKAALAFMHQMKPLMSSYNKDGLGYAAIDESGALFGERWHVNADSMLSFDPKLTQGDVLLDVSSTTLVKSYEGQTNSFGKVDLENIAALTMHTRMATSGREFKNTHPFVYEDKDTSLIHNGVISNTKDFEFKVSTCDSEAILISYLNQAVNNDFNNIQPMADSLRGYYACGVFSRNAEGERIMDVFKGPDASLYGVYILELDSLVFCTSETDIASAAKSLGFTLGKVYPIKEGILLRFNAKGEMINKVTFTPAARYQYNNYSNYEDYKSKSETSRHNTNRNINLVNAHSPEPISKAMSEYLHTIPNLQKVMQ